MTDRPTPASDETDDSWMDNIKRRELVQVNDDGTAIYKVISLTDEAKAEINEHIAAAVQAESRKLLERITQLLPEVPALYERYEYKQGFKEAVELTRALLDSEQQKLGGSDATT